MPDNTIDNLDVQTDNNGGGYEDINKNYNPYSTQKPPVGLLKKILSQSKESQQFSPYKKEEPSQIKLKKPQKTLKPYVAPTEAPMLKTGLEPITNISNEVSEEQKLAIDNAVAKKFRTGVMPEDVYRSNIKKGIEEGEFKVVKDENGYPDVIRKAPGVLTAIADGWNGYFKGIEYGLKNLNPFLSSKDKANDFEETRRYNQMVLSEEPSKTREYGELAGGTLAGVATTLLPIGEAAIAGKALGVGMNMVKIGSVNTGVQTIINAAMRDGQAEEEAYNIARDNGADEKTAYDVAQTHRGTYLATGAAEGLIASLAEMRVASAFSKATTAAGDGFLAATKKYLAKTGEQALSTSLGASVMAASSVIRDLATEDVTGTKLDVGERAWQNAKGMLLAGGAIAAITGTAGAGYRGIEKWYKSRAINYLATLDKTFVENELKSRQQQGLITEAQATDALKQIEEWNQLKKDNPNIPEDKQPTILGLLMKKKGLENSFLSADDSSKPDILKQIEEANKRIDEAYKSKDPLAGEIDEDGNIVNEKTKENATTETTGEQQEGVQPSSISEHQGIESEQKQKTNEADNSNRPVISSEEIVSFAKRIASGERMSTPEDLQFYDNNKTQIESELKKMQAEAETPTQLPKSFDTEQGKIAWDTIKKVILDSKRRGRDYESTKKNARVNLEKSKAFQEADDVTRNKMIMDLNEHIYNENQKSAPSVGRILGQVKGKMNITESAALKRLFKRQAQTSKEVAAWAKKTRQDISTALSEVAKSGKLKVSQVASILRKYDALNLSNSAHIDRFVNYVSNVMNDADYAQNLEEANSMRKRIKKYADSKNAQVNLSEAAKDFLGINPEEVSDIKEYRKHAEAILNGLKPSRAVGTEVSFNEPFNTQKVRDYSSETKIAIEENNKQSMMDDYQDLVDAGVIDHTMTFDDMNEIVSSIEEGKPKEGLKDKERYIRAYVNKRFNTLSALAKSLGFPSEFGEFANQPSEHQKSKISELLKIGIDDMKIEDAYRAVEALNNFVTNGTTSGLDAALSNYYGYKSSEILANRGFKSRPIKLLFSKGIGRAMYENFTTLPVFFDGMFGNTGAEVFKKEMGLTDIENGRAKAVKQYRLAEKQYLKSFSKESPNGVEFFDPENVYERGMYAFIRRGLGIGDKSDRITFARRKSLIEQSIQALMSGSEKDKALGEWHQKVYDKILKDSKNISDVESKVHKTNAEAVEWWTKKWDEHYDNLRDVSLNVYNQELGKDNKYNPDIYKRMKGQSDESYDPFENGNFASFAENIPAKKSGTLYKNTQVKNIPDGKFIDLNFDFNNIKALDKALTDINTAFHIRKAKSFLNSEGYAKIVNADDAKLVKERVAGYVKRARGMENVDPTEFGNFRKATEGLMTFAVRASLGSLAQPFKQTIPPLVNTLANAGFNINFGDITNPDIKNFIDNSGRAIAIRGIESDANILTNDQMLLNASKEGFGGKTVKLFDNANRWWLKAFVEKPDVIAARLSFMAYYRDAIKKMGIDPSEIDWATHKINDKAADYAQHMVDVQQNVSDRDLQGNIMGSRNAAISFGRNMVMPLSNFIMNQKARMYTDFINATSKTNLSTDRARAIRSLGGLALEMTAYNLILMQTQNLYSMAADKISGVPVSEKEKEKRIESSAKTAATNFANDLLSPFPVLNVPIDMAINGVMNATFQKDTPEDLRFNLYQGEGKKWYDDMGLAGIGIRKTSDAYRLWKEGITGGVSQDYFGKEVVKKVSDQDKPLLQTAAVIGSLSQLGVLPSDFNSIAVKVAKGAEKRAMSKTQQEAYDSLNQQVGGTLNNEFARAISIKDPQSRAKYVVSMVDKYGKDKVLELLGSAAEVQTPTGKYALDKILDDATAANMEAILTDNPKQKEFANLFSLKDQSSRAYKLAGLRNSMPKEEYYKTLKWAIGHNLLNEQGATELFERIKDRLKNNEKEIDMFTEAISDQ